MQDALLSTNPSKIKDMTNSKANDNYVDNTSDVVHKHESGGGLWDKGDPLQDGQMGWVGVG